MTSMKKCEKMSTLKPPNSKRGDPSANTSGSSKAVDTKGSLCGLSTIVSGPGRSKFAQVVTYWASAAMLSRT